jgi:hypothetical protein
VLVGEGVREVDVLSVLMSLLFSDVMDEVVEEEDGGGEDVNGGGEDEGEVEDEGEIEDEDESFAELSRRVVD